MDAILKFLLEKAPFLYKSRGFRFTDSLVAPSFGGDSYVVLESKDFRIRLVSDRAQLFLDIQALGAKDWYSIDAVYELLTGEQTKSAELNDDYAGFLEGRFEEIASAFSKQHIKQTAQRLDAIKKTKSKRMFG